LSFSRRKRKRAERGSGIGLSNCRNVVGGGEEKTEKHLQDIETPTIMMSNRGEGKGEKRRMGKRAVDRNRTTTISPFIEPEKESP